MKTRIYTLAIVVLVASICQPVYADTVASEDFDGGSVNVISGHSGSDSSDAA